MTPDERQNTLIWLYGQIRGSYATIIKESYPALVGLPIEASQTQATQSSVSTFVVSAIHHNSEKLFLPHNNAHSSPTCNS